METKSKIIQKVKCENCGDEIIMCDECSTYFNGDEIIDCDEGNHYCKGCRRA